MASQEAGGSGRSGLSSDAQPGTGIREESPVRVVAREFHVEADDDETWARVSRLLQAALQRVQQKIAANQQLMDALGGETIPVDDIDLGLVDLEGSDETVTRRLANHIGDVVRSAAEARASELDLSRPTPAPVVEAPVPLFWWGSDTPVQDALDAARQGDPSEVLSLTPYYYKDAPDAQVREILECYLNHLGDRETPSRMLDFRLTSILARRPHLRREYEDELFDVAVHRAGQGVSTLLGTFSTNQVIARTSPLERGDMVRGLLEAPSSPSYGTGMYGGPGVSSREDPTKDRVMELVRSANSVDEWEEMVGKGPDGSREPLVPMLHDEYGQEDVANLLFQQPFLHRDRAEKARAHIEGSSDTGAIAFLLFQRGLKEGGKTDELEELKEEVNTLDRPREYLPITLLPFKTLAPVQLGLMGGPIEFGARYRFIDPMTQRTYTGDDRAAALQEYLDDSPFPPGIVYHPDPASSRDNPRVKSEVKRDSGLGGWDTFFSVVGLVGGALMFVPGVGTAVGGALLGASALWGLGRGAMRMHDQLSHGGEVTDTQVMLEGLGMIANLAALAPGGTLAVRGLKQGGNILRTGRAGTQAMRLSTQARLQKIEKIMERMGLAADMSALGIEWTSWITEVMESDLSEDEKRQAVLGRLARLAIESTLVGVDAYSETRGMGRALKNQNFNRTGVRAAVDEAAESMTRARELRRDIGMLAGEGLATAVSELTPAEEELYEEYVEIFDKAIEEGRTLSDEDMARLAEIEEALDLGDRPKRYQVREGDSLSEIAGREYGDPDAWERIWEANRDVIGDDPHQIAAGQTLVIPSPGP